jgi:hypothetical protein
MLELDEAHAALGETTRNDELPRKRLRHLVVVP